MFAIQPPSRDFDRVGDQPWTLEFPLVGPAGEKIDLWRTLISHGLTSLPPMAIDEDSRSMQITLSLDGTRPRAVRIGAGRPGYGLVSLVGRAPGRRTQDLLIRRLRYMLRLDDDLSAFYALAADDPDLEWVTTGAGRMMRSASVFEDVIKTVCTTNCAWSATQRMVGALCEHLGQPARGAPASGPAGRAFPTPQAMAEAGESFYQDVARAGYRGRYLRAIAQSVADGSLDLESLGRSTPEEISDDELAARLLELPGVGPYAAAHIMLIMGRHSRLVLDSWTRPKYARLIGRKAVKDAAIERRFRRYEGYAGLAFWTFVTRDWVDEPPESQRDSP